jgi:hypothetical protein
VALIREEVGFNFMDFSIGILFNDGIPIWRKLLFLLLLTAIGYIPMLLAFKRLGDKWDKKIQVEIDKATYKTHYGEVVVSFENLSDKPISAGDVVYIDSDTGDLCTTEPQNDKVDLSLIKRLTGNNHQ